MTTDHFGEDHQPARVWTIADIYKDLIRTSEIAPMLNVNPPRVVLWIKKRARNKCPKPVRSWDRFQIYSAEEWRTWYAMFCKKHEKILSHQYLKPYLKPYGAGESFFTFEQEFDEY